MNVPRRALLRHFLNRVPFEGAGEIIPIAIAGVRVDLVTTSSAFALKARDYFRDYSGTGPAAIRTRVEPLEKTSSLWEDADPEFHPAGRFVIQRDFCANRHSDEQATAILNPEGDDGLHNFLRWVLPPLLLKRGAFLLHGTGIVRDGRGFIFFGQSGAGKSTTAGLVRAVDARATVVGDDAVIVQLSDGLPELHAAPLGCGYSRAAPPRISAPLAGFYAIEQDSIHGIKSIAASEGTARLLASAMCVQYGDAVDERIGLAAGFAATKTGIQKLHFRKDAGFWSLVTATASPKRTGRPSKEELRGIEQSPQA